MRTASMTSMMDCLRLAGRVFGLALLLTSAVVAQTTAPPPPASAQTPPSDGQTDGQYTIKTNVNEVNLIFTVTDKHGRFIQNLQQRDFALLENQKAPAQVFTFTQQTNLPLRVGIMIDAST